MTDHVLFPRKWLRVLFKMWQGIIKASLLERAEEKQQELEETIQALELQVHDLQGQVEVLQEQIQAKWRKLFAYDWYFVASWIRKPTQAKRSQALLDVRVSASSQAKLLVIQTGLSLHSMSIKRF